MAMVYMQYKGRDKAAKVVEFVAKWLNLCLSTVAHCISTEPQANQSHAVADTYNDRMSVIFVPLPAFFSQVLQPYSVGWSQARLTWLPN